MHCLTENSIGITDRPYLLASLKLHSLFNQHSITVFLLRFFIDNVHLVIHNNEQSIVMRVEVKKTQNVKCPSVRIFDGFIINVPRNMTFFPGILWLFQTSVFSWSSLVLTSPCGVMCVLISRLGIVLPQYCHLVFKTKNTPSRPYSDTG